MNYSEIEQIAKKNKLYMGASEDAKEKILGHNSEVEGIIDLHEAAADRSRSREKSDDKNPGVLRHGVQSTLLNNTQMMRIEEAADQRLHNTN